MNKIQWITFSIVFSLMFLYFMFLAFTWNSVCSVNSDTLTACYIKAQSYAIPGIASFFLAIAFFICALLEPKKR